MWSEIGALKESGQDFTFWIDERCPSELVWKYWRDIDIGVEGQEKGSAWVWVRDRQQNRACDDGEGRGAEKNYRTRILLKDPGLRKFQISRHFGFSLLSHLEVFWFPLQTVHWEKEEYSEEWYSSMKTLATVGYLLGGGFIRGTLFIIRFIAACSFDVTRAIIVIL